MMSANQTFTKPSPGKTSQSAQQGRPTTRFGMGRTPKSGRNANQGPSLGFVSAFHPVVARGTGLAAAPTAPTYETSSISANATSKPVTTKPKAKASRKQTSKAPLPPRMISRPDRSKKDIIISATGITHNVARQVGEMGKNGKYHWVTTNEFDPDVYDFTAALKKMSKDERKKFLAEQYIQIDIDVAYDNSVTDVLKHMDKLGKIFTENARKLFINLIFPDTDILQNRLELSPDLKDSVMIVPTVAALVPLVDKIASFQSLNTCIVTLYTAAARELKLWPNELDHAVPFMALLRSLWRLDWFQRGWADEDSRPRVVHGKKQHYLNKMWSQVEEEREAFPKLT